MLTIQRDRFKAIANKLIPGKGSSSKEKEATESAPPSRTATLSPAVVMSDTELSDTEPQERDRRLSLDQDDRGEGLSRNNSSKTFGLRNKKSFSFGKRKSEKPRSGSSSVPTVPSSTSIDNDRASMPSSGPSSPVVSARLSNQVHGVGPTAAQMAYIHRILAPPPNSAEIDPISKLRAPSADTLSTTHSHTTTPQGTETGLEESLRAFTSVEVLEGENAFACKRCWKIKSGRYQSREATLPEVDESAIELLESQPASPEVSALGLKSTHPAPPSISIADSETSSIVTSPSGLGQDDGRLGRAPSVASRSSASAQNVRAPSPLRRQIEMDEATRSISNLTIGSSTDGTSGVSSNDTEPTPSTVGVAPIGVRDSDDDGLSDTDTSDEEQPDTAIHVGRPKPTRRQSSHFVMRRAFKRYLFAKAPEVLIFHFKRFKQTQKTSMMFTSFYDLKK
jgi:ubiquitin carboxyl-terminal hydrolase 16/45